MPDPRFVTFSTGFFAGNKDGSGWATNEYASALSPFAGSRARLVMTLIAILAGAGFVILSDPWETGVILLAFVPVGMGVFAVAAWLFWAVAGERADQADLGVPVQLQPVSRPALSASFLERLRARLRFT